VLADATSEGAGALLCLGDLVGYGAEPEGCVELVAERAAAVVAGNHEHGALGLLEPAWFNAAARQAARWTGARLDEPLADYLRALPLTAVVGDATLVHASPREPEDWDYLVAAEDGLEVFGAFATRICFVGHSHRPAVWSQGSSGPGFAEGFRAWPVEIQLEAGRRYVVNVGSVGQPRDRDARAAYALWDPEERRVTIRRVGYDHRAAAAKILAAGLPPVLAERLAHGA
jgi:diadenosine tetraphosphatase ApaH/serine/threonine PP2A family protein phosphatase